MAAPPDEPCELWTSPDEISDCCGSSIPDSASAEDLQLAALFSSKLLWRFSGYRYPGACTDEIWPCVGFNMDRRGGLLGWTFGPFGGFPSLPYRDASGAWWNLPVGTCADCWLPEIKLPGPVSSVTLVEIDGVALDSSAYAVRGYRRLARIDGGFWPAGQNPPFRVVFVRGRPIPDDARKMAAIFACQKILPLLCSARDCVPDGVPSSVSADGVTQNFDQLLGGTTNARQRTGIAIVDLWLDSLPRRRRRMKVVRADDPARGTRKFT